MPRRALVRDQTYAIQRKTLAGGIMARITRRRLLKLSASGAVAARTGGLAAVLATGRAPAFAQGTTVHWLRWADFVPAPDLLHIGPARPVDCSTLREGRRSSSGQDG